MSHLTNNHLCTYVYSNDMAVRCTYPFVYKLDLQHCGHNCCTIHHCTAPSFCMEMLQNILSAWFVLPASLGSSYRKMKADKCKTVVWKEPTRSPGRWTCVCWCSCETCLNLGGRSVLIPKVCVANGRAYTYVPLKEWKCHEGRREKGIVVHGVGTDIRTVGG